MKAVVYTRYGSPDVLELRDIEIPKPLDDEVLIEVYATSVNAYDWHFLTGDLFLIRLMGGLFKPKRQILGADIAGKVAAVGNKVTKFKPGDEVFGTAKYTCGGFAEYVCAQVDSIELKPENVSFEDASTVSIAALTALQGLRNHGKISSGQKVLIYGASGGVGTFAVQIAKSFQAEVTAVCSSANLGQARLNGADYVLDYTKDDFDTSGKLYDLILIANGNLPLLKYTQALNTNGTCVLSGGSDGTIAKMLSFMLQSWWISRKRKISISTFIANINSKDLTFMKELLASGKVKPVIDRRYPLDKTADALRYLGQMHARGKIVIEVKHHEKANLSSNNDYKN